MKTVVEWKNKKIEVSSRYVGYDTPPFGGNKRSHFKVSIAVSGKGGDRIFRSDFWQRDKKMSAQDLREALECFCSDAISGDMSVEDFRDEFGYDDIDRLFKVHNACKDCLENFRHLGLDPYELSNWLREKYDI